MKYAVQLQDINSYNFPRIYYNFLIEDKTWNEIYLFCPQRLRPPRERVRVVSQYLDLTFTKLLQRFPPWNTTRSAREALLITAWTNYDWRVTKMVTPDELSIVNTSVPASAPALFAWGWLLPARKNRRQEKLTGKMPFVVGIRSGTAYICICIHVYIYIWKTWKFLNAILETFSQHDLNRFHLLRFICYENGNRIKPIIIHNLAIKMW